jgi:hypothetical protein
VRGAYFLYHLGENVLPELKVCHLGRNESLADVKVIEIFAESPQNLRAAYLNVAIEPIGMDRDGFVLQKDLAHVMKRYSNGKTSL